MKRKNINGFTLRAFGYSLEVVTIKHTPRVIALSNPIYKNIWRVEI